MVVWLWMWTACGYGGVAVHMEACGYGGVAMDMVACGYAGRRVSCLSGVQVTVCFLLLCCIPQPQQ